MGGVYERLGDGGFLWRVDEGSFLDHFGIVRIFSFFSMELGHICGRLIFDV